VGGASQAPAGGVAECEEDLGELLGLVAECSVGVETGVSLVALS
jgi:hypothetical protein